MGSPCGANGAAKYVLDPVTFSPYCNEGELALPPKIIGNVPILTCAPGSRRYIHCCSTIRLINLSPIQILKTSMVLLTGTFSGTVGRLQR